MKQERNSKRSWKNVPKIISTIPNDKNKLIMYVDESGEGNKKVLSILKSLEEKGYIEIIKIIGKTNKYRIIIRKI